MWPLLLIVWIRVDIVWTSGLTLTDVMGSLGMEVVDALSVSCQERGFLCCGDGDCNDYALDLAATLQKQHFKSTHFY